MNATVSGGARGPVSRFFAWEGASGVLLLIAAAIALMVANSDLGSLYRSTLAAEITIGIPPLAITEPVQLWINDLLMAVFFLLVGCEIKRELLAGQLDTWREAALPSFAALGGMAAPALIFSAFNHADPVAIRGWAIPAATDIAFALGVLALLGKRVPVALKVFLTAVAILDDMGAIIIIAVFYTADLSATALVVALGVLGLLIALNRFGVKAISPYLLLGAVLWVAVLKSGVHATLAGVVLAACIPLERLGRRRVDLGSPLIRLEHAISRPVGFVILPLFGFANAGVAFGDVPTETLVSGVPLGVALGLFVGKQIGVLGGCWLAMRAGIAAMPHGVRWRQLYGIAALCGIGFTMSLFIAGLAYTDELLMAEVKIAILVGSTFSALYGAAILATARTPKLTTASVGADAS